MELSDSQRLDVARMNRILSLALLVILLLFPTFFGYFSNPSMAFSGLVHTTDGNTYLSFINQAKTGSVLFTNFYTREEVPALMVRPTYLVAGLIARLFGTSPLFA